MSDPKVIAIFLLGIVQVVVAVKTGGLK